MIEVAKSAGDDLVPSQRQGMVIYPIELASRTNSYCPPSFSTNNEQQLEWHVSLSHSHY
jgi:hypothetical protein